MKRKVKFSMQNKILGIIAVLLVISLAFSGTIAYIKSSKSLEKNIKYSTAQIVEEVKNHVDEYLGGYEKSLTYIANDPDLINEIRNFDNNNDLMNRFEKYIKNYEDVVHIYFGTKEKDMYLYPQNDLDDNFDPTTRPWYQKAKNEKKLIWTDPYVDDATRKVTVSAAMPIYDENKAFMGVLSLDISLETLNKIMKAKKVGESGYISVIDNKDRIIVHQNPDIIGDLLTVTELTDAFSGARANTLDSNLVDYQWTEKDGSIESKFAYFSLSDKTNWAILATRYYYEITEEAKILLKDIIVFGVVILLVAVVISIIFARNINKNLRKITESIEKMRKGDLTTELDVRSGDEIQLLSEDLNSLIDSMKEQTNIIEKVSNGDLNHRVEVRSENDVLSKSLNRVVDTLKDLIHEMSHMSQEHDAGDIDVMVDVTRFEGAYKEMAEGVNNMVKDHISINKKALACVQEFGKGNFDAELEQFLGKKAFINENIEELRGNLKLIHNEINQMVEKCVTGQLSERANAANFEGDWKILIAGLNQLLDAVIEPINEAIEVLVKMSRGDLSVRIEGAYQGEHAEIKNALNSMGEEIQGYISEVAQVLSELADKNLAMSIEREYMGNFIQLKDSINHIVSQFNIVMSEINEAAVQVESGADHVASSSQSLSQGTSEQASAVEEISATITEVSEQTKESSKNANKANELSMLAKENAETGNQQMEEMLSAMDDIKVSSTNISNIIKAIDDIAFQTNILALNAAVEAARAGEHGKGFAVVAEEVRNLAARSADAAKETTQLIDNSINKVEEGYKIANKTAEELNKIVSCIGDAVEIVGTIASASTRQAEAMQEINRGVSQISDVTQSNTATSEESASASEEMASQAQMLKGLIQEFKLEGNDTSTTLYLE